jgi:hypothetical protein
VQVASTPSRKCCLSRRQSQIPRNCQHLHRFAATGSSEFESRNSMLLCEVAMLLRYEAREQARNSNVSMLQTHCSDAVAWFGTAYSAGVASGYEGWIGHWLIGICFGFRISCFDIRTSTTSSPVRHAPNLRRRIRNL